MTLQGKTVFVSGGSRGIGLAIALKAAKDGANIVIGAKTAEPHPHLPGTVYTAAEAVEKAGGKALPIILDVREPEAIEISLKQAADHFGGIDVVVNSASAIFRLPVWETLVKRYDLMQDINVRGTFLVSRAAIPYLRKSANPHVLTLSPPINLDPKWAKIALSKLEQAHLIEVPYAAHLPSYVPCVGKIDVQFLEADGDHSKVDDSCLNTLPAPGWN